MGYLSNGSALIVNCATVKYTVARSGHRIDRTGPRRHPLLFLATRFMHEGALRINHIVTGLEHVAPDQYRVQETGPVRQIGAGLHLLATQTEVQLDDRTPDRAGFAF